MSVLQFDAHSDLRETYEDSPYSHACIMARVAEFLPYKKITQVGIRALCIEESVVIKKENINTFFASAIRTGRQGNNWQKAVCDTLADEVYITFDVDYFDPSIMPSTGTPEPDGFLYNETLDVFREMIKAGKKIVGFDIVESAPVVGVTHREILVFGQ
jgi:agmatinase